MYLVTIMEPTEYVDRGFQTASWWEKVTLDPGTYEVVPWSNLPYYNHFKVPATIVSDYFAANFAGASYQPYDSFKNAGKRTAKWVGFPPTYELKNGEVLSQWERYHPTFKVTLSEEA
jgi:hypothetical protein